MKNTMIERQFCIPILLGSISALVITSAALAQAVNTKPLSSVGSASSVHHLQSSAKMQRSLAPNRNGWVFDSFLGSPQSEIRKLFNLPAVTAPKKTSPVQLLPVVARRDDISFSFQSQLAANS